MLLISIANHRKQTKMTESELCSIDEAHSIFDDFEPRPFAHVDILSKGKSALEHANTTLGSRQ
jgi:phosphoribosylformylglycinamidine synthase